MRSLGKGKSHYNTICNDELHTFSPDVKKSTVVADFSFKPFVMCVEVLICNVYIICLICQKCGLSYLPYFHIIEGFSFAQNEFGVCFQMALGKPAFRESGEKFA